MSKIFDHQMRTVLEIVEPPDPNRPIHEWLDALAAPLFQKEKQAWLLAHTFTGVVWGRHDKGQWHLSSALDSAYAQLSPLTLLEGRVFNPAGEVYVWRDGEHLRARAAYEDALRSIPSKTEIQILWGTTGTLAGDPFTIMTDGEQSLKHVVPIAVPEKMQGPYHRPLRLHVRHYITCHEETGLARITLSRLVQLSAEPLTRENGKDGS